MQSIKTQLLEAKTTEEANKILEQTKDFKFVSDKTKRRWNKIVESKKK